LIERGQTAASTAYMLGSIVLSVAALIAALHLALIGLPDRDSLICPPRHHSGGDASSFTRRQSATSRRTEGLFLLYFLSEQTA
jgi:hypothetical protein